jgi:hypothetical protein
MILFLLVAICHAWITGHNFNRLFRIERKSKIVSSNSPLRFLGAGDAAPALAGGGCKLRTAFASLEQEIQQHGEDRHVAENCTADHRPSGNGLAAEVATVPQRPVTCRFELIQTPDRPSFR